MRHVLATLALFLIASSLSFGGDDTTPPELRFLRFTPEKIDTSTGSAEVKISFAVSDAGSRPIYFEASFVDPSGAARQSGSAKFSPSAANSITVTFPRFSASGTWTLSQVFLSDASGNTSSVSGEGLTGHGFPTRLEVQSAQDTLSPTLTALEVSPTEVDTTYGPVDVKVNYTATDDLSGVKYIELNFVSPSGVSRRGGSAKLDPAQSVSKSISVTFLPLSEPGQWNLSAVFLSDAAGNTLLLDSEGIIRAGFATILNVKSALDTAPPVLTGVHFMPEVIDTSSGDATVNVDITATDDSSGVNQIEFSFLSPSGAIRQSGSAKFDATRTIAKSIPVKFAPQSEAGQWELNAVFLSDAAGNTLSLDADGLERLGIRSKLIVK